MIVLVLGLGLLAQCEPQVTLKQTRRGAIYLPAVYKAPRQPLLGIAASWNGGADAVRLTRADWYLNWSHYPSIATNAAFVPMINIYVPDDAAESDYVMGANEPNVAAQVNLCPADYVATWREIEIRYSNRKLVAPGVGDAGNVTCVSPSGIAQPEISGLSWLIDFRDYYIQAYGRLPQIDVISFHCYMPPESPCDYRIATSRFVALAKSWGVSEVWVTEFDAGKWGAQNPQYLIDILAYWRTVPMITRIAYYQDFSYPAVSGDGNNSALTNAAGQLTVYGELYK